MSHRGTEDNYIYTLLPKNFKDLKIMDVGHGLGLTGYNIRSVYSYGRAQSIKDYQLHGLEAHIDYHNYIKPMNVYDKLILQDAADLWPYPPEYFDISIAQQVLEHNTKEQAYKIIENMEYYTSDLIILATCSGHDHSRQGRHGNPKSGHRYFFTGEEFKKLGYKYRILWDGSEGSRVIDAFARFWLRLKDKGKLIAWKHKK